MIDENTVHQIKRIYEGMERRFRFIVVLLALIALQITCLLLMAYKAY